MHLPPPYLEPEEPLEPTVFEDLVGCCGCDVRLAILASLIPGPLAAGEIAEMLDISASNLSNHLRALRGGKLVTVVVEKKRRVYRLGPAIKGAREPGLIRLWLVSDDGCDLAPGIKDDAQVCRRFTPALWKRLNAAVPSVTVLPRAAARPPTRRGSSDPRPPRSP